MSNFKIALIMFLVCGSVGFIKGSILIVKELDDRILSWWEDSLIAMMVTAWLTAITLLIVL